ncbi:MAG: hypothetical protein ACRCYD_05050, partial [Plesiomonas sp.]
MKKLGAILLLLTMMASPLAALEGEMGYFGGISPGTKLPTTAERLNPKAASKISKYTLPYKETVYVTGRPVTMTGTIEVRPAK